MAILLSLLTAALFGTGDFCGGLAARRATIVQVVFGSHLIGLIGSTVAALFLADAFTAHDFLLGIIAGAFGGVGVGLLYRGLGRGPMSVVAPLTAVTSAAVPAFWGFLSDDPLTIWAWIGVALALVAIGLVSSSSHQTSEPVTTRVVTEALLAGAMFGLFFIVMDATDGSTTPWPVVGARTTTTVSLLIFLLLTRGPFVPSSTPTIRLIAATGVFDTTSNVLFLYATDVGNLTTVSVLSSLYPIATVLLARFVLHDRMTRPQLMGCSAALVATALIAVG